MKLASFWEAFSNRLGNYKRNGIVDNLAVVSASSSDVQDVLVPASPQDVAYLAGQRLALVKNNPMPLKVKSTF